MALVTLCSCSKNKNPETTISPIRGTLTITAFVQETEDINPTNDKFASTANKSFERRNIIQFKEFDAIQYIGPSDEINNSLSKKITHTTLQAATPIASGKKYMLYLFKKLNNQGGKEYVTHKEMTVRTSIDNIPTNENVTIEVSIGTTYLWYAYTTNDNSTLPIASHTANTLIINDIGNKGIFYDAGEISISNQGNTPLNISFKQKMARISLEFDARGMFTDRIQKLRVNINNGSSQAIKTRKGKFDLINNQFFDVVESDIPQLLLDNLSPEIPSNRAFQSFDPIPTSPGSFYDDRKIAYIYTTPGTAIPIFNANLTELTILTDNESNRAFTGMNSNFQFQNVQLQEGRNYRLKVDLIESAIPWSGKEYTILPLVEVPVAVANSTRIVKWARTNLYYKGDNTRNPFRFHHTYKNTYADNTYFAFMAAKPNTYPTIISNELQGKDPCKDVHPTNTWRTADAKDFLTLGYYTGIGITPLITFFSDGAAPNSIYAENANQANPTGGTKNLGYITFNTGLTAPQANTYPSNNLVFHMNGYPTEASLVGNLVTLSFSNGTYGEGAYYWTIDNLIDLVGLASLGSKYHRMTRERNNTAFPLEGFPIPLPQPQPKTNNTYWYNRVNTYANVDINLIGLSILKTDFHNVRCVRNE